MDPEQYYKLLLNLKHIQSLAHDTAKEMLDQVTPYHSVRQSVNVLWAIESMVDGCVAAFEYDHRPPTD
jgi:hypothetical protein